MCRFDLRLAATLIIRCTLHIDHLTNPCFKQQKWILSKSREFHSAQNWQLKMSPNDFGRPNFVLALQWSAQWLADESFLKIIGYCNSPHIPFVVLFYHLTEKSRMIINCSSLPIEWFWRTEKRIFNKKSRLLFFFINDRDSFEWIFLLKFFFTSEHTIQMVENCWQIDLERVCIMTSEIN